MLKKHVSVVASVIFALTTITLSAALFSRITRFRSKGFVPQMQDPRTSSRDDTKLATLVASDSSLQPIAAWEGSPLLVRELRLAVCTVPKTASSAMKRLLLRAIGAPHWNSSDIQAIHFPPVSGLATLRAPVGGDAASTAAAVATANALLRDPSWTRLVIVRDPVERFVSAFLDKCGRESPNWNCPVKEEQTRWSMEAVLAALEATAHSLPPRDDAFAAAIGGMHSLNSHFLPAALLCDLRLTRRAWRVLPLHPDLAGAIAAAVGGLQAADGARPGLLEDVQRWAREMLVDSHAASDRHNTPADMLVRELRAAAAAEARLGSSARATPPNTNNTNAVPAPIYPLKSRILVNASGAAAIDLLRRIECFYAVDYHLFADVMPPAQWCASARVAS